MKNKIQEEIKQKIIKVYSKESVDSPTDDERADRYIITKEMLLLNELDELRAHRYNAGLIALLKMDIGMQMQRNVCWQRLQNESWKEEKA